MSINIIVACTKNGAIGRNNELLYHLKEDLKNFKTLTTNNVVIMGRKTMESLPKFPLENRINVLLSKNDKLKENHVVFDSLEKALEYCNETHTDKEVFIIGGGQVYKEVIDKDLADNLYMTIIDEVVEDADTFFPFLDKEKWILIYTRQFRDNKYVDLKYSINWLVRSR